jgi:hypothetical protein
MNAFFKLSSTLRLSQLLAALALYFGAGTVWAAEWPVSDFQVGASIAEESRFFYVSKGEQWRDTHFQGLYSSTGGASVTISLDGHYLTNQTIGQGGTIRFGLPTLNSGFHRITFEFKQQSAYSNLHKEKTTVCDVPTDGLTSISEGKFIYSRNNPDGLQVRNLPDALFNPQSVEKTPYNGSLKFDLKNPSEMTAIARLASRWSAAAGIRWLNADVTNDKETDFGMEIRHAPQLASGAQIGLSQVSSHPILTIVYKDDAALDSAVNALLTPGYLDQLHSGQVTVPGNLPAPQWGTAKTFLNLADLGIEDFRLESGNRALSLSFPPVWKPTDLLQGSLALRTQDGLLKGSILTVWLDNAMAGSMSLDQWDSAQGTRALNYLGPNAPDSTYIGLRLESNLMANGDCQPQSRGSLWVDAHKSLVNLPHRFKTGVAAISVALINRPELSVDGSPGSMGAALALVQTATRMLFKNDPIAVKLSLQNKPGNATVHIQTNPAIYQQQVVQHQDRLFEPFAEDGTIVLAQNGQYQVIAANTAGAENFMRYWAQAQELIADGVTEALIARDGTFVALETEIPGTNDIPQVRESTITRWVGLIFIGMLAGIIWWIRRTVRKSAANKAS